MGFSIRSWRPDRCRHTTAVRPRWFHALRLPNLHVTSWHGDAKDTGMIGNGGGAGVWNPYGGGRPPGPGGPPLPPPGPWPPAPAPRRLTLRLFNPIALGRAVFTPSRPDRVHDPMVKKVQVVRTVVGLVAITWMLLSYGLASGPHPYGQGLPGSGGTFATPVKRHRPSSRSLSTGRTPYSTRLLNAPSPGSKPCGSSEKARVSPNRPTPMDLFAP